MNYDDLIKAATAKNLPGGDWRQVKAQVRAESTFRPRVVSPAGARGLMQIMPATFAELGGGDPFDPATNIDAGTRYMAKMIKTFSAPRTDDQRYDLALAAYNAGAGNIIKAQQLAGKNANWPDVAAVLHNITGHHSEETIRYVEKIRRYYSDYLAGRA